MEIKKLHELFLSSSGVTTDTRKIENNSIFFALKGENFDANTFTQQALSQGAAFVVIDDDHYYLDKTTIVVDNVLETLQALANYHRNFLKIPIIAITGSNGKTTSKELICAVLSKKFNTKATVGNLNNHIGVPLTLLSFDKNTQIGIVEMGANHQKEIEFLCDLTEPDFGYITNFGKAHLEGFGGIQGVIKGKSEMLNYLKTNHKIAFINQDDPLQAEKSVDIEYFGYSNFDSQSFLKIDSISANPFLNVSFNDTIIKSHLIGIYNANNIAIAILIGKFFEIPNLKIKQAIEGYIPENNRSQMLIKNSNKIILDAYNANPSSMKVAIENFCQILNSNKIVFLGDMFELGSESYFEHQQIVNSLIINQNITCYFVGKHFFECQNKISHFNFFETFESLKEYLSFHEIHNNIILIKGSRGMALERILDCI
jgi:UDP-N-acetylmuramoyl-tripeptide--D-alanyl-D-alanine ligase